MSDEHGAAYCNAPLCAPSRGCFVTGTHNHTNKVWDKVDLPDLPPGHIENLPPTARERRRACGFWGYTERQTREARAAYSGLISYLDAKINSILQTLEDRGPVENTVVVHTSDQRKMATLLIQPTRLSA